jgi:methionyl-tRNA formyltransferase
MRILMLGTGPFAVPTFKYLLASAHEVPALITRPPRSTRSKSAPAGPMQAVAEEHGLPVFMPESINSLEGREAIARWNAELLVVCDYGQILSAETLALTPRGGINLHGSLLPKYRGAAPVNWAVWNGDAETGVTVIHMTPRLDGGPMIAVRRTPIGPEETTPELEVRLSDLGVDAVREAIDLLAANPPEAVLGERQDQSLATKAPRLAKTDGDVAWSRTARQIFNQVRALKPWPGTYTNLLREGQPPVRLILDKVSDISNPDKSATYGAPGTVIFAGRDNLHVATGDGQLSLDIVQPAGKRAMAVGEWLRGCAVKAGDRFGSVDDSSSRSKT